MNDQHYKDALAVTAYYRKRIKTAMTLVESLEESWHQELVKLRVNHREAKFEIGKTQTPKK